MQSGERQSLLIMQQPTSSIPDARNEGDGLQDPIVARALLFAEIDEAVVTNVLHSLWSYGFGSAHRGKPPAVTVN